jgi:hypothetical protein
MPAHIVEAIIGLIVALSLAKAAMRPMSGAVSVNVPDDTGGLSEAEEEAEEAEPEGSSLGVFPILMAMTVIVGGVMGLASYGDSSMGMAPSPGADEEPLDPKALGTAYENEARPEFASELGVNLTGDRRSPMRKGTALREVTLVVRKRRRKVALCRYPWPTPDDCRKRTVGKNRKCRIDMLVVHPDGSEELVEFKLYEDRRFQRHLGRLGNQAACFVEAARKVGARLTYVCGNDCDAIEHMVAQVARGQKYRDGSDVRVEFRHSYCPDCLRRAKEVVRGR